MNTMNFDQMLETWRDVNPDALRQALQTQEARMRRDHRLRRRALWFPSIFGTGMAVWAGVWIAITITNGWPAIYAIAAGVCFGMFALGVGALWVSRGQAELQPNFGNTLKEEVRHSLALVDYQLSVNSLAIIYVVSLVVGVLLFCWTIIRSQDIDVSSGGWWPVLLVVWLLYKAGKEMRKAKLSLETRQRRLRELLAALAARE